jgi:hypothetical protein
MFATISDTYMTQAEQLITTANERLGKPDAFQNLFYVFDILGHMQRNVRSIEQSSIHSF